MEKASCCGKPTSEAKITLTSWGWYQPPRLPWSSSTTFSTCPTMDLSPVSTLRTERSPGLKNTTLSLPAVSRNRFEMRTAGIRTLSSRPETAMSSRRRRTQPGFFQFAPPMERPPGAVHEKNTRVSSAETLPPVFLPGPGSALSDFRVPSAERSSGASSSTRTFTPRDGASLQAAGSC